MSDLSDKNFGIIIAYVLPGFVALWGVSHFSATVESWIGASQQGSPTVAGFCYVTLASLAAGLTVSVVRWGLVDSLHHATGIVPPAWKFAKLDDRLQGFLTLVESHYRYYQFYSNMFVAVAFVGSSHQSLSCAHPDRPPGDIRFDRTEGTRDHGSYWPESSFP